jgi:uncharacterized protein (DUF305 family)
MRRFIVVSALAALLAACGQDDKGSESRSAAPTPNDADVTFVQNMIPHHEQAIRIAKLVDSRTERAELRKLAGDIQRTQAPEIAKLRAWLERWGKTEMPGMDHSQTQMPGMMGEEEIIELMGYTDTRFDLAFIDMMQRHHQGAVEMARTELRDGSRPEVKTLAQQVIDAQQLEIDQMTEWRQAWAN